MSKNARKMANRQQVQALANADPAAPPSMAEIEAYQKVFEQVVAAKPKAPPSKEEQEKMEAVRKEREAALALRNRQTIELMLQGLDEDLKPAVPDLNTLAAGLWVKPLEYIVGAFAHRIKDHRQRQTKQQCRDHETITARTLGAVTAKLEAAQRSYRVDKQREIERLSSERNRLVEEYKQTIFTEYRAKLDEVEVRPAPESLQLLQAERAQIEKTFEEETAMRGLEEEDALVRLKNWVGRPVVLPEPKAEKPAKPAKTPRPIKPKAVPTPERG